jgi:bacterioferritin-associated ferredoxin
VFACICHAVTEQELVTAVLEHGCDSVESVGDLTDAGTGCGTCHDRIEGVLGACGKVCPIGVLREQRPAALVG